MYENNFKLSADLDQAKSIFQDYFRIKDLVGEGVS